MKPFRICPHHENIQTIDLSRGVCHRENALLHQNLAVTPIHGENNVERNYRG